MHTLTVSAPAGQWMREVEALLDECAASPACETGDRLREAYCLLAERALSESVPPSAAVPAQDFARLLACNAHDSAAIAILGPEAAFLVSRAGTTCMATVVRLGGSEAWGEGATPALALLCAHLASICEEAGRHACPAPEREHRSWLN